VKVHAYMNNNNLDSYTCNVKPKRFPREESSE